MFWATDEHILYRDTSAAWEKMAVADYADLDGIPASFTPSAHAPTHKDGGTDELDVSELAGAIGAAGEVPETDGAAVTWVEPDGRYDPKAHVLDTTGPHTGTLLLTDLEVGARGEVIIRGAADWEALGVGVALQALLSNGAGADPYWGAPTPAAHEGTHVAGGADDIDSALDARALGFANQGEVVFRAAAANTLGVLATGVAGQALLTGGAAADVSWGAPAPATHEGTHVAGGADDIDSALDARALGLVNQGDITFHAAAANTLATLGPGAAGTALLSQGAAADLVWGAPATQAHVLATTGPHSDTLPLTDLAVGTQGEVIIRGAADWEALGVGAALQALLSGGAGADPYWGAPTPAAHVLATTGPHSSELPLTDLAAGAQGEIITRTAADWVNFGVGAAGQALLSGGAGADVSWGAPAPAAHQATHNDGGTDEIEIDTLAGANGLAGEIVESNGSAMSFVEPDSRYVPKAHVLATTGPHTDTLPLTDLAVGARGEIITRTVADWAALAVGAAGQALLSGGAGADVSWGAPAPATHEGTHVAGGADDIDAALDGRAIGFSEQGDVVYASGATTLAALAHGNAGEALLTQGHGANPVWGAPAPAAHQATHNDGGTDEIEIDTLAGANGAAGEIVESDGLAMSFVEPDGRYVPKAHVLATTGPHSSTLPLTDLEVGVRGEVIIRGVADWEALGVGAALQALLSGGAGADPYWGAPTPAAHQASHNDGGTDEIEIDTLAGANGAAGEIVESDGLAMSFVEPDSRYVPKAHVLATTGPHTNALPLVDLEVGVQGEVIHRGAADWEALAVGADGQVLMSGGAAADVAWEDHDKALHDALNIDADTVDSVHEAAFLLVAGTRNRLIPNPSGDHSASGDTISATAGENVAIGDLCYLKNDGKFWKADADAEATSKGMLALATAAIAAEATGVFLVYGKYRDDTWNWTLGQELYIHTTGGNPTGTRPAGANDIVRIIGHAYTTTILFFNPDQTYLELV